MLSIGLVVIRPRGNASAYRVGMRSFACGDSAGSVCQRSWGKRRRMGKGACDHAAFWRGGFRAVPIAPGRDAWDPAHTLGGGTGPHLHRGQGVDQAIKSGPGLPRVHDEAPRSS